MKLCGCGCGKPTSIIKVNNKFYGHIKGEYRRFATGHYIRTPERCSNWNGGIRIDKDGYVLIYSPNHKYKRGDKVVLESRLIAEKVFGKPLPRKSVVHHVDEKKGRERPNDIVICEDNSYHSILHRRIRAYRECSHANWIRCNLCHKYSDPKEMYVNPHGYGTHHGCHAEYERKRRAENANSK